MSSKELTNIKNIAIVFGGRSAEHEISLLSAKNIVEAIDTNLFNPILVGLCRNGQWCHLSQENFNSIKELNSPPASSNLVSFLPGQKENLFLFETQKTLSIDIAFPILHGPFGEDGCIQGFFRTCDIPFIGSGVLGSAVGMDKDFMKRLFEKEGLPLCEYKVLNETDETTDKKTSYQELVSALGSPFFIKPANMGSSIGVHKIKDQKTFDEKIKDAFLFDNKVIAEKFISGREIECAVLGNAFSKSGLQASGVGEIHLHHEFYSYKAKYLDETGAKVSIPASLDDDIVKKIQDFSLRAFKTLNLSGLARVDFFYSNAKELYINEVNTLPGFTNISMYPKLWEERGITYTQLITKLLDLAEQQHQQMQKKDRVSDI